MSSERDATPNTDITLNRNHRCTANCDVSFPDPITSVVGGVWYGNETKQLHKFNAHAQNTGVDQYCLVPKQQLLFYGSEGSFILLSSSISNFGFLIISSSSFLADFFGNLSGSIQSIA